MRSKVVRMLALALLLCGIEMIAAQQPGSPQGGAKPRPGGATGVPGRPQKQKAPEKSKLEVMLAEALKNNPDIRVAAAKLAEADAELNRTRLQVTQKVVTVYHAIETQKKSIAHQESACQALQKRYESGTAGLEVFAEATQALTLAKGKLEELEAQLPALLGKTASAYDAAAIKNRVEYKLVELSKPITITTSEWEWVVRPRAAGPMAERLRKALQTAVKVDYKDMTFGAILDDLAKKVAGVSFRIGNANTHKTSLRFEEALPLSAVLQALSDEFNCYFYVREYGILATHPNSAPPGAMKVEEFLRQKPANAPAKNVNWDPWGALPWNVPDKIEGTVKRIDAGGNIVVSLNSVDGLLSGHTLHLYRPADEQSKIKYLGTIRIFFEHHLIGKNEMMGRPLDRLTEPPKIGDKVSARMPSGGKNSPAENVEGFVKSVDASGLLTLSIGSDAGLAKGHTLELFRLNPESPKQSKYLGTIRILEAQAKQSVAQAVGRLADTPKVGDRVASRILGK